MISSEEMAKMSESAKLRPIVNELLSDVREQLHELNMKFETIEHVVLEMNQVVINMRETVNWLPSTVETKLSHLQNVLKGSIGDLTNAFYAVRNKL